MRVTIGWVYPESLSTYGDRGNVIALSQRARWRGLEVTVVEVHEREVLPSEVDIVFIGGGQDAAQTRIADHLQGDAGRRLVELAREGCALLAICGGYKLLCHEYVTSRGVQVRGVGLFDAVTRAARERLVGDVRLTSRWGEVVGFENHSGRTYLGPGTEPLGQVQIGHGNNGDDGTEGVVMGAAIGSYLHGPLLPRNPAIADWLLEQGIRRRHPDYELTPLADDMELATHRPGRLSVR